ERRSSLERPLMPFSVTRASTRASIGASTISSGSRSGRISRPAVQTPQLVLRRVEPGAIRLRQILAGAVDVERQHRHGGLVGATLAPAAAFRRAFQRLGNAARILLRKN